MAAQDKKEKEKKKGYKLNCDTWSHGSQNVQISQNITFN